MADTYIINASNQTVTGTAAGEIFEFDSTLKNGTFTNVVINAAGRQRHNQSRHPVSHATNH